MFQLIQIDEKNVVVKIVKNKDFKSEYNFIILEELKKRLGELNFEIKFVEEEKNFFQLGKDKVNPYMYGLTVEAFKYNGELFRTGYDFIDADSSGFIINQVSAPGSGLAGNMNVSGATYVYLAIA